jgi:hypothetical protein
MRLLNNQLLNSVIINSFIATYSAVHGLNQEML